MAAIALGSQRILPALQQGYTGWAIFNSSKECILNVLKLVELPLKNFSITQEETKKVLKIKEYIELKNVNYSYPKTSKKVLNNVNLKIYKKDFIGLVGSSGSGKSTLIDLIMGLLDADQGSVSIDGNEINTNSIQGIKNNIFWKNNITCPQSIFLPGVQFLRILPWI